MKRFVSLMLLCAMLFAILPRGIVSVNAETVMSGFSEDNLRWVLDNEGILTISGNGPMADYSPAGGGAGSWVYANIDYDVKIQKIIISEGITKIGDAAFAYCTDLVSVEIPETVTQIGDWAFLQCEKLETVKIPSSVDQIGMMAFQACKEIERIELSEGATVIGEQAFAWCDSLRSIELPGSVTSIEYGAFLHCSQMNKIVFKGDAPKFGNEDYVDVFVGAIATAYYPKENLTWTADVMQNYGGILTWVPMDSLGNTNPIKESPSLFIPVVESRIVECKFDSLSAEKQQECRGILVDLDGNGSEELVLRFLNKYDLAFEVWSIQKGNPVCINYFETDKGGLSTNGCVSSAVYENNHYIVYQWKNSGMESVNDMCEIFCLLDGQFVRSNAVGLSRLDRINVIMRAGYYLEENELPEGMVLSDLISYLQNSKTESDQYADVEIPSPVVSMVSFNNFFVGNYYDNLNQMYQYDSVAQGILTDSGAFQINWNSCLSALSNKEFLDVLKLENHPEYYYQTVLLESIMQTKLDDDYWSALMSQVSQISLDAVSYYVKYDANFTSYDKLLKQKLNTTMTDFSIDSVQYKRLSDYYGQYCKQLKTYDTVKDIYDLTVKADGTVEDFFNALSNYASVYGTTEEIISALEYLKVHLEGSDNKEDQYILTAVNNILTSLSRTLDEQLVLNCLGTAKDLLWGVFWAAISDAFPNVLALDIASFTIDSGLTLSNVFFPTTISADSYCKLYADYAIEVVTREALNKAYTTYSANPTDELATITVDLYDLLGYTYVHEIEVATVLSEQLHKDGLINGLKNLFSSKNVDSYKYEQDCINAYDAYLNEILSVKVEAQKEYGLAIGSLQPVITVYFVNGKVVAVNETTISAGDTYHVSSGEFPLPDFVGLRIEIEGYYLDQQFNNAYEETAINKPLSLYCNLLLTKTSDGTPVLVDPTTGISASSGKCMAKHTLSASVVTSGNVYSSVEEHFTDFEFELYDISILENGAQVQLSGEVTVEIPVNPDYANRKTKVYHVTTKGEFEDLNATSGDGVLQFTTTHFSYYVVVYENTTPTWFIPIIIGVVVCSVGVSLIFILKAQKKRRSY